MMNQLLERSVYLSKLREMLILNPVVAMIGARQVGKTTLARQLASEQKKSIMFDMENPAHLARLQDPLLALSDLEGLIVIDEIQYLPNLFPLLRVLVDRPNNKARFLILGSAAPELLRQSSETLAGRISYLHIEGFGLGEVGENELKMLWLRGGFPRSFLAPSEPASIAWRLDFIRNFLERDLPQLGLRIPAITMRRFWMMLAHYHGQTWNGAELARAFGVSEQTARRYLDILTGTFIIRQLQPWWENISKRQVKAPKIYLSDTGILHTLFGIESMDDLAEHPKVGASWEGFAMDAIIKQLKVFPEETFFWSTHSGAEIDLVVIKGQQRIGFEFKRSSIPKMSRSVSNAIKDLGLSEVSIIHAGDDTYSLANNVRAVALKRIFDDITPLRLL